MVKSADRAVAGQGTDGAAGGVVPEATAPGRVWGNAFARATQNHLNLPIRPLERGFGRAEFRDVLRALDPQALTMVVTGPGGMRGLLALSPGAVTALVEAHMTRRLRPAPPPDRRPTRTDAAVVSVLVEDALDLAGRLGAAAGVGWLAGWTEPVFVADPRPLALTMSDVIYRHLVLSVEFGDGGTRKGDVAVALPMTPEEAAPWTETEDPAQDAALWTEMMGTAVAPAPVELRAVLWHLRMPLREALALAPGMELSLPKSAIDEVRIEGADGRLAAVGRLGQTSGHRAVRLRDVASGGGLLPGEAAGEPGGSEGGVTGADGQEVNGTDVPSASGGAYESTGLAVAGATGAALIAVG